VYLVIPPSKHSCARCCQIQLHAILRCYPRVNGVACGQGKTQRIGMQIVYSINVFADGPGGAAGCGAVGRLVQFQIGGRTVLSNVPWDNERLHVLDFGQQRIYLPLLRR
jgi:hypothetical protein